MVAVEVGTGQTATKTKSLVVRWWRRRERKGQCSGVVLVWKGQNVFLLEM